MIGSSIYLYRRTNPPVHPRLKLFLTVLRATALALIVFILFEPVLKLSYNREEKPIVAVLLDTSASMSIKDEEQSRSQIALMQLSAPLFNDFSDVRFDFYQFNHQLLPFKPDNLDLIQFKADGTDLGHSLKRLRELTSEQHLSAILLLSDGINNLGENPLRTAEELSLPVFPLSVGKPIDKKDVIIANIVTNQVTYVNNELPVDVTIRAPGYSGERLKLDLYQKDKLLDSKYVDIGELAEAKLRLFFTPAETGFRQFRVETPVLEGELTAVNNQKSFFVKVLESRIRILCVTGSPCPDFAFIRRALDRDPDIEADYLIAKPRHDFYQESFDESSDNLKNYDLVILLGFPPKNHSSKIFASLEQLVRNERIPLLFIAGNNINYRALSELDAILPFRPPAIESPERLASAAVSPTGLKHPVSRIHETETENQALWNELPPLFHSLYNAKLTPTSEVLLNAKFEPGQGSSSGKEFPLLVIQKLGQQKSMAFLAHGLWRWDLMMWGVGKDNQLFQQLVSNCVRWLVNKEDTKPVLITPEREIFRSGEPISFLGQVYDENYLPMDGAELKLNVFDADNRYEITLSGIGDGKYEGALGALEGG
ncbi:MAG TPA: VWA domain-containing protein, partial [bacterium]|nr:VWA domain-containing protein [bacterium]